MKRLILTALLVSGLTGAIVQSAVAQQDSTKHKKRNVTFSFGKGNFISRGDSSNTAADKSKNDSIKHVKENKPRFIGGITLTRIDIGFSRFIDNGSFTLSPENDFLDYRGGKTSTFSFDVLQFGYRFNSNFKIYLAGGFDWTHIRLNKDITMQKDQRALTYIQEDIHFSKNRFSSSYVHIPFNFELRTKENDHGNRFYLVFGPEVSFLLNGKVKQISSERGKVKVSDDYNFEPFRYGGTIRLGYGSLGVFAKYYASDMFTSTAQKGLKNMSFGITLGLN